MHYLYCVTNLINNKVYIGQTINAKKRWKSHKVKAKRCRFPFERALIKYGFNNFDFQVIATCKTQEDANYTEEELIKQYNSLIENGKGYNVMAGANASPWTQGMRDTMSRIAIAGNYGAKLAISGQATRFTEPNATSFQVGHKGIRKNYSKKITDAEIEDIKQRIANGEKKPDIAKHYNISIMTLYNYLNNYAAYKFYNK